MIPFSARRQPFVQSLSYPQTNAVTITTSFGQSQQIQTQAQAVIDRPPEPIYVHAQPVCEVMQPEYRVTQSRDEQLNTSPENNLGFWTTSTTRVQSAPDSRQSGNPIPNVGDHSAINMRQIYPQNQSGHVDLENQRSGNTDRKKYFRYAGFFIVFLLFVAIALSI
mmetsp:Transcript_39409/g.40151  ORF Transcript_39409/g.40151 Transcript_39409/m.40151 type:complete len:165 (+) Transcript_39409:151-645(+)